MAGRGIGEGEESMSSNKSEVYVEELSRAMRIANGIVGNFVLIYCKNGMAKLSDIREFQLGLELSIVLACHSFSPAPRVGIECAIMNLKHFQDHEEFVSKLLIGIEGMVKGGDT
jgi:hypothetical protein